MRYHEIIPETRDESGLTAVPFDSLDPLTRKPVTNFRIMHGDRAIDMVYGRFAKSPTEALAWYYEKDIRALAWNQERAASSEQPRRVRRRIRTPRPDIRVWIVPAKDRKAIEDGDNEQDNYLYHVTSWPRARQIIQQGLLVDQSPMFSNYQFNTGKKVFLTERDGVTFWIMKIEQHLEHNYDKPPPVAVLRVRRADVKDLLRPDAIGTKDARASCYYVETDFR